MAEDKPGFEVKPKGSKFSFSDFSDVSVEKVDRKTKFSYHLLTTFLGCAKRVRVSTFPCRLFIQLKYLEVLPVCFYYARELYVSTGQTLKQITPEQQKIIGLYADSMRSRGVKSPDMTIVFYSENDSTTPGFNYEKLMADQEKVNLFIGSRGFCEPNQSDNSITIVYDESKETWHGTNAPVYQFVETDEVKGDSVVKVRSGGQELIVPSSLVLPEEVAADGFLTLWLFIKYYEAAPRCATYVLAVALQLAFSINYTGFEPYLSELYMGTASSGINLFNSYFHYESDQVWTKNDEICQWIKTFTLTGPSSSGNHLWHALCKDKWGNGCERLLMNHDANAHGKEIVSMTMTMLSWVRDKLLDHGIPTLGNHTEKIHVGELVGTFWYGLTTGDFAAISQNIQGWLTKTFKPDMNHRIKPSKTFQKDFVPYVQYGLWKYVPTRAGGHDFTKVLLPKKVVTKGNSKWADSTEEKEKGGSNGLTYLFDGEQALGLKHRQVIHLTEKQTKNKNISGSYVYVTGEGSMKDGLILEPPYATYSHAGGYHLYTGPSDEKAPKPQKEGVKNVGKPGGKPKPNKGGRSSDTTFVKQDKSNRGPKQPKVRKNKGGEGKPETGKDN